MHKHVSRFALTALASMTLALAACQPQLLPPAGSTMPQESSIAETMSDEAVIDTATADTATDMAVEITEEPVQEVAQESEESSVIDAIVEAIEEPVGNPVTETVIVSVESAAQPVVVIEEPAAPAAPLAYVTGTPIRIHAGPGEGYALQGVADQGTTFALIGQADNCQWYQVQHPALGTAWIAGTEGNVTIYYATCPQIPLATN